MTEQQSGLRFDIYERVHLEEGARGIQELDEVELVPHIQVVSQSEQAVLRGYLRLSGSYSPEGEEGKTSLEYQIPVEITLPISRVGRAEDLFVEIENFDIDLMSSRSLNVTGVLSLHGVEMASAHDMEWRSEEERVFVHRTEDSPAAAVEPAAIQEPEAVQAEDADRREPSPLHITELQPPFTDVPAQAPEYQAPHHIDIDKSVQEREVFAGDLGPVEEADLQPEVEIYAAQKKDVKVGFGSKKVAELAQEAAFGIKSLLHKSSSIFLDKRRAAEAAAAPVEEPKTESVEWKKLFLNPTADGQEFRKLKLAIVQKEETLETIAQRYQINPRELQLLNRLQDGDIAEGKAIYIPR